MKHKAEEIMDHLSKPIYRNGCEVPMGFAVTKVTPIVEEFQGIKIKNQNFSVPFTFRTQNNRAVIENKKMPKESTNFYISIPGIEKENTALRNLLKFVPTEISTDTVNGGLSLAYEIYWYRKLGPLDGLEFKPSYNFHDANGNFVRMDVNTFKEFDDFLKIGGGISGFGNMEESFYERESAYGINIYLDIMDIFRMTYVRRHGSVEDNDYLYLGIENIPSLIYWLNH